VTEDQNGAEAQIKTTCGAYFPKGRLDRQPTVVDQLIGVDAPRPDTIARAAGQVGGLEVIV
jgi:hypothetical protein